VTYVVIHGLAPMHIRDDVTLRGYIANIVYSDPEFIRGGIVAGSRFVVLVGYSDEQRVWADGTFNRMPSFSYGAQLTLDTDVAWREFGAWFGHYAGVWTPADDEKALESLPKLG